MKKTRIILCSLLAIVMMLSLIACGGTDQEASNPQGSPGAASPGASPGGTSPGASPGSSGGSEVVETIARPSSITIGTTDLGRFLDGASPQQNVTACDGVYDSLFLIDPKTKLPYSEILEDWFYEDDLTFVMVLKPGIYFSNGAEAKSEDLLFSVTNHFERRSSFMRWIGDLDVESCYTRGEYTAVLKWNEPFGPGIWCNLIYLYNEAWAREVGWDSEDWFSNPNGSGPFRVAEYVTDEYIRLVLKDDYWKTDVTYAVEEWIIRRYPDQGTMVMALEVGDIAFSEVPVTDFSRLSSTGAGLGVGVRPISAGSNQNFHVSAFENPIFWEESVRAALAYGVDWAAIGEMYMGDLYRPTSSSIISDSLFYLNVGAYEYDPVKARQILADAGYSDGDIQFSLFTMNRGDYRALSEGLQYYCQEMGIVVDLEFGDMSAALARWTQEGNSDVGFMTYGAGSANSDPHHGLAHFYVRGNTWVYGFDDEVRELGLKAMQTVDFDTRLQLYHEFQQLVKDRYLIFPIYENTVVVGYRTEVFTEQEMNDYVIHPRYMRIHYLSLAH